MKDLAETLLHALIWLAGGSGVAVLIGAVGMLRRHGQNVLARSLAVFCFLAGLCLIGLAIYMMSEAVGVRTK